MKKLALILSFVFVNPTTSSQGAERGVEVHETPECTQPMVLDKSRIPDFTKWQSQNTGRYTVNGNRVEVTLSLIPQNILPAWLKENSPFIDFELSAPLLLCLHKIPNGDISKFNLGTVQASKTLAEIKQILSSLKHPLKNSYDDYIVPRFRSATQFDIGVAQTFEADKNYYSMPLIIAIGRSTGDSTIFTFRQGTYLSKPVVVIEISGAQPAYYDFSQFPTLVPG